MIEYVIVLPIICNGTDDILLVLKDRPAYLAGRLNLVGGKIEPGETPEQAAVRELKEESGFHVLHNTVPAVCGKIIGKNCIIYCLNCNVVTRDFNGKEIPIKPRDGETEKVEWHQFWAVKNDPRLMPNLRVIIPLLFMDSRGWTITDSNSSLDVPTHDIMVSLTIDTPYKNE